MKTSLIYSVTVTTLHYLYEDEPREYSHDRTEINCDFDSRSSLFLSFEAAEKRKIDENSFSSVPWEVVAFDENEGFALQAWYDPSEVWFNFTLDNPAYPVEFSGYLWRKPERKIEEYAETLYELMPEDTHWIINDILRVGELDRMDDRDFYPNIDAMLYNRPELTDAYAINLLLDPVMRNNNVPTDVKIALWQAKVSLDSHIRVYKEDYPEGY